MTSCYANKINNMYVICEPPNIMVGQTLYSVHTHSFMIPCDAQHHVPKRDLGFSIRRKQGSNSLLPDQWIIRVITELQLPVNTLAHKITHCLVEAIEIVNCWFLASH